jgi:predicted phosphodiesterase
MRIQLASDLHLEMLERYYPGERLIAPAAHADLLVLAGDIANGPRAIQLFAHWPVPVIYVAGNHEFYDSQWQETRALLKASAAGTSVVFLDNELADLSVFEQWASVRRDELARIRILGSTLWTDYELLGPTTRQEAMTIAQSRIADHRTIQVGDGRFGPGMALEDHLASRAWLSRELAKPYEGTTVVVTHHGPHPSSVHPRYAGDSCNAAFVSDLTELVHKTDLWLHGHVHDNFDYRVGQCRVVANPRGYALNRGRVAFEDLVFENLAFQWNCVFDTGARVS